MKVVCAWCQRTIRNGDAEGEGVSHGMCPECSKTFLRESLVDQGNLSLDELLDRFPFPVLAVDGDVVVLGANRSAAAALGKPVDALIRRRGGVAIECVNAATAEGCGATPHCAGCQLRTAVTATFTDGQPRYSVLSTHSVGPKGASHELRIRCSAVKLGKLVVVSIEGLNEA